MNIIGYCNGVRNQSKGTPIFKVKVIKSTHFFKSGEILIVTESFNPIFDNHWSITDSLFITKENCKIL